MTVLDIVERCPETEEIFSTYDDIVGKCVLCNCLFDTIGILSIEYDINLENLIDRINKVIKKLKGFRPHVCISQYSFNLYGKLLNKFDFYLTI